MDFQNDVIARSHEIPVVVDFWAPWCGPCRVLGPVIEQIAEEQKGTWELVKVNTEEHQDVAMEYGIRSIPNVKMFYKGDVTNEFAGALPRHQILAWLEDNLPSEEKNAWSDTLSQLENGDRESAVSILESFLAANPHHSEAKLYLARHLVLSDPGRSAELTAGIKLGDPNYDLVEDVNAILQLSNLEGDQTLHERLRRAYEYLRTDRLSDGVQELIDVVMIDKGFVDDLPRRASIAVFRSLGSKHEITKKYRRIFDMALY